MFEILANIHFLRPIWFLALLPVVWIIWRAWQVNRKQGAWHKVIDPKFRKLLLGENASAEPSLNEKFGYVGLGFAWLIVILALSGPWVKSIEVPAQKSQQGVVIVLDLSLSMLADDITPNRLERVKYRLTDLLKQYPEYATGMVAYAGSAHTISPISEDNQTLLSLLPSLNPVLMPSYGSNPLLGFELANNLFKGAQITQGHLLWITDDIENTQVDEVVSWIKSHSYSVTVLTVGTQKGGVVQIPNYGLLKDDKDKLIMPSLPTKRFNQLEHEAGIKWVNLKPADDDVKALLPPEVSASTEKAGENQKEVNHPLDIGPYFLFLLLPFVAVIFRKGVLLSLTMTLLIPVTLMTPQPSYAEPALSDFSDVFKSPNQQGYDAWQAKKYEAAEALFENPQWRASALYRQGKYKQAAKLFEHDKSINGLYNLANALTMSGDYEKAKAIYEKVLQLKPDFTEAKDNLAVVKNLLAQKPPKSDNEKTKGSGKNQQENSDKNSSEKQKNKQTTQQNQPGSGTQNQANSSANQSSGNSAGNASNNQASQSLSSGDSATDKSTSSNDNNGNANSQNPSSGQPDNTNSQSATGSGMKNGTGQQEIAESNQPGTKADGEGQNLQPSRLEEGNDANKHSGNRSYGDKAKPDSALTEEEQAKRSWLQQIPDQPGLFLKRKFEYQFKKNQSSDNKSEKQW
jgi:Ca-activated chloride channel family protein